MFVYVGVCVVCVRLCMCTRVQVCAAGSDELVTSLRNIYVEKAINNYCQCLCGFTSKVDRYMYADDHCCMYITDDHYCIYKG